MEIYHNPRCAKSRQTLALLQENGVDPEILLYLDSVPSPNELKTELLKLDLSPIQLVRKGKNLERTI